MLMTLLLCGAASAQCEVVEIVAGSSMPDAHFGQSVSMESGRVLAGASDEPGGGAAYLHDAVTGELLMAFTAPDAAPDDAFGAAVDLRGSYAVIGAVLDDDMGKDSGSAYVFDVTSGALVHKLVAPDGATVDLFGIAVALAGDQVLVGADGDDDLFTDQGAVYVFDLQSGALIDKILAPDAEAQDRFGGRLAVDGDRALVSAWQKSVGSATSAGQVYLVDLPTRSVIQTLTASDPEGWDYFGDSIALDGERAVVGAPRTEDLGVNSGAVYVFDLTSGQEMSKLLPTDGDSYDQFGESVALTGELVLVGAPFQDEVGGESGAVYLFDLSGDVQVAELFASGGTHGDLFGIALSVEGDRAAVGASFDDTDQSDAGSVRVLAVGRGDCDGDGTPDACRLAAGASVDLDMNGVPDECEGGPFFFRTPQSGQWLTVLPRSSWLEAELDAQAAGGHLATIHGGGEASWIRGNVADGMDLLIGYNDSGAEGVFTWIAGDPAGFESWYPGQPDDAADDGSTGADFVVWEGDSNRWRDERWTAEGHGLYGVDSDDCDGNERPDIWEIATGAAADWNGDGVLDSCSSANFCDATVNSSGDAAVMGALGSPVLAENALTLTSALLPPNRFGYFLTSFGTDYIPLFGGGMGNLCLAAPIYRLSTPPSGQVLDSGSQGRFILDLDLNVMPSGITLQPGDVLFFQAWFRDVVGGTQTSNTSDGLEIRFR